MKKFKEKNWQIGVARMKLCFFVVLADTQGFPRIELWKKFFKKEKFPDSFVYQHKAFYCSCWFQDDLNRLIDIISKKIVPFSKNVLQELKNDLIVFQKNLNLLDRGIRNLKIASKEELLNLHQKYCESIRLHAVYMPIMRWIEATVQNKLSSRYRKLSEKDFYILSSPVDTESGYAIYQRGILKFSLDFIKRNAKGIFKNKIPDLNLIKTKFPDLYKKINYHIREYYFVTSYIDFRKPIDFKIILSDIKNTIGTMDELEIKKKYRIASKSIMQFKEKQKKLIEKLKINKKDRELLYWMRKISEIRIMNQDSLSKLGYRGLFIYRAIGKKLKLKLETIKWLKPEEIDKLLKIRVPISKKVMICCNKSVRMRQKELVIALRKNGELDIIEDKPSIIKFFNKKEVNRKNLIAEITGKGLQRIKTNEVKGLSAQKGIAQGRVVLVSKIRDLKKVKPGDILITSHTTPDFIPAMQQAAAFVTNEGGIMSHAAIVAREIQKPCIVGTRIATRVFKEGDLVEVNATEGVVRKIK